MAETEAMELSGLNIMIQRRNNTNYKGVIRITTKSEYTNSNKKEMSDKTKALPRRVNADKQTGGGGIG